MGTRNYSCREVRRSGLGLKPSSPWHRRRPCTCGHDRQEPRARSARSPPSGPSTWRCPPASTWPRPSLRATTRSPRRRNSPGPGAPMTLTEMEDSVERVLGVRLTLAPALAGGPTLLRRLCGRTTRLALRLGRDRILLHDVPFDRSGRWGVRPTASTGPGSRRSGRSAQLAVGGAPEPAMRRGGRVLDAPMRAVTAGAASAAGARSSSAPSSAPARRRCRPASGPPPRSPAGGSYHVDTAPERSRRRTDLTSTSSWPGRTPRRPRRSAARAAAVPRPRCRR
jgi:hypothetical protein